MGKTIHVVVNGKTSAIECLHCGAEKKLRLPASITQVVERGKDFAEEHKACKRPWAMKIV